MRCPKCGLDLLLAEHGQSPVNDTFTARAAISLPGSQTMSQVLSGEGYSG